MEERGMTHDELREKVARAILLSGGWSADEIDDPISGPSLIACALPTADAALAAVREALREPSEAMALQGWLHLPRLHPSWSTEAMKGAYRAMLAASPLAAPQKETSA
jgi:hypothetical protein